MIGVDKSDSLNQIIGNLRRALNGQDPNLPSVGGLKNPISLNDLSAIWDSFASYAGTGPYLQYAFTARQAIDNVLSGVWPVADYEEGGVSEKNSQQFAQLHVMRDDLTTEINRLLSSARASFLPATGVMGQGQMGSAPAADQPQTLSIWGFPLGDFGTITSGPFSPCPFRTFGW